MGHLVASSGKCPLKSSAQLPAALFLPFLLLIRCSLYTLEMTSLMKFLDCKCILSACDLYSCPPKVSFGETASYSILQIVKFNITFKVNHFLVLSNLCLPLCTLQKFYSLTSHILIYNPTRLLNDPSDIYVGEKPVSNDLTYSPAQLCT